MEERKREDAVRVRSLGGGLYLVLSKCMRKVLLVGERGMKSSYGGGEIVRQGRKCNQCTKRHD